MKKCLVVITVILVIFSACGDAKAAQDILIEAEHFESKGGWKIDAQFTDIMGSAFLLAHGMGRPVENAKTTATFPKSGQYALWVRCRDWVPGPWAAPGRFQVIVDGKKVPTVFGTQKGWNWQKGGTVTVEERKVTIELADLTGFDGRCDALYFTRELSWAPPDTPEKLQTWRNELTDRQQELDSLSKFDVVIVGGGIAGCGAAMAAAQSGLRIVLIQDRPVLGGNASHEIRVHTEGITGKSGHILNKLNTEHWPNGAEEAVQDTQKRHAFMDMEENVNLFLGWRAFEVDTDNNTIESVSAREIETGKIQRFFAPVFIDCTGDGWIGFWAGAEFRYGRESREEFDEGWEKHGDLWSPQEPDNRVMGASLLWNSHDAGIITDFPEVPWAMPVAKDLVATKGEWYWEFSDNDLHLIEDGEVIRDHLLRAIYGTFSNAKKQPQHTTLALEWVGFVLGRRESRRLIGDYIYTMNDMVNSKQFPDTIAEEKRTIDVHYQRMLKGSNYDFLAQAMYRNTDKYYIPYRCLYSKNITNLLMAGRCFSCSHIGLGGPRVMNTTGQMGVAVGYAASLCVRYDTNPRGVYQHHIAELRKLIGYE